MVSLTMGTLSFFKVEESTDKRWDKFCIIQKMYYATIINY